MIHKAAPVFLFQNTRRDNLSSRRHEDKTSYNELGTLKSERRGLSCAAFDQNLFGWWHRRLACADRNTRARRSCHEVIVIVRFQFTYEHRSSISLICVHPRSSVVELFSSEISGENRKKAQALATFIRIAGRVLLFFNWRTRMRRSECVSRLSMNRSRLIACAAVAP